MMSRHFALNSEHIGAISKRLPHAKNQHSVPGKFLQSIRYIYIYIYIYIVYIYIYIYINIQARFACLRCAAGRHFVSAGGSLQSPGVTLVNYKGDNISKYVCPAVIIYIARKITKFINF